MKKHLDLFAVILFLIVLAALVARYRGIPVPTQTFGFSSGG